MEGLEANISICKEVITKRRSYSPLLWLRLPFTSDASNRADEPTRMIKARWPFSRHCNRFSIESSRTDVALLPRSAPLLLNSFLIDRITKSTAVIDPAPVVTFCSPSATSSGRFNFSCKFPPLGDRNGRARSHSDHSDNKPLEAIILHYLFVLSADFSS